MSVMDYISYRLTTLSMTQKKAAQNIGRQSIGLCSFRGDLLSNLGLDEASDQSFRSFNESESVREAALKQDTDAIVACHVRCRDQGCVLPNAKVSEVVELGQNEQVPYRRILYLCEFPAEVFDKDFLNASTQLHGLLADEFEALIECGKSLVGHKGPRLKGLFDL